MIETSTPALDISISEVRYGQIRVLQDVKLTIEPAEVVSILGPNGAGKSTVLQTVMGLHTGYKKCTLELYGSRIDKEPSHKRVSKGIALCPAGRRIFTQMSVLENLQMGSFHRHDASGIAADTESMYDLFPPLEKAKHLKAGNLSGGQAQMLAIARALMSRPRVLLLDEPSLGLSPKVASEIFQVLRTLRETGLTIVIVEQNARLAMEICDNVHILRLGRTFFAGTREDAVKAGALEAAYFS